MIIEYILNGTSASLAEGAVVLILMIITAFLSITIREYVRSSIVLRFGGTAQKTLNPLKAVTLPNCFSVIILALFSVSWIKPKNPGLTRGKNIIAAISAPLTNFLIAVLSMIIYVILFVISTNITVQTEKAPEILIWISMFFSICILVNIAYALFDLIPLPGTSGGLILAQILPEKARDRFLYFDKFSYMILLFIAIAASRSGVAGSVINSVATSLEQPLLALANLLFSSSLTY